MQNFSKEYIFNNGIKTKNRVFLAPMTNSQSFDDGRMSEVELNWLRMRAQGGFGGLITAGATPSENAKSYPGQIGVFSDDHIEGLRKLSEMAKQEDSLSIVQFLHGGMRSPSELNNIQPSAPSAIHLDFPNFEDPRELTEEEIQKIKKEMVEGAVRVYKSGATGIELHAANGYLFTQFLSQQTNMRTDRWGGSNRNRARFLLETLKEVRDAVPPEFIVGVRILAEDSAIQKGFDIDETLEVIGWMNQIKYNYLHLSSHSIRLESWKYHEVKETNIKKIRRALKGDIALIASGSVNTVDDANFALNEGADFVALGRAAIHTPDWPKKVLDPEYKAPNFPLSVSHLEKLGVTPPFVNFLKSLPFNIVSEEVRN